MDLRPEDIETKAQIGTSGGQPVYEVVTKGGFHLVLVRGTEGQKKGFVTLGTGSHRAVARYLARQRRPDLRVTELTKSEDVSVEHFRHLLPQYEELTNRCNQLGW